MQAILKPEMRNRTARMIAHPGSLSQSFRRFLVIGLALLACAANAFAQITVRTLGGGRTSPTGSDAGFVDGNTLQTSQFNAPFGAAVDAAGNIYIADRKNGSIRKLDVAGNRASTLIAGLDQPVALAFAENNDLYVLTQGDGLIRKLDRFGNVSFIRARLFSPTALAVAGNNVLFVTESSDVVRIDPTTDTQVTIKNGLGQASGIAVLDSGLIAVSDAGNHRILFLNPDNGSTVSQVGVGTAGFRNGSIANALFNQPHQLAKAPNGSLLVADRGNHRVRSIGTDGSVTTLYGIDPSLWEGPQCLTCNPIILPGWFDGSAEFAEAREPVGIAVSKDGKLYVTELFYHLVREITVPGLTAGSGGGSGANNVVLPPIISPDSGYFPSGQQISVRNPNTNAFFSNAIYYTTDGSDPNTNSARLQLADNLGVISWREAARDLTSLRIKAFVGANVSGIVSGRPAALNEIGVTRPISGGPGSTVVVPLVVNLRPGDQLKSLQFRVEAKPELYSTPIVPELFRPLSISSNDFIRVVTSSESSGSSAFNAAAYTAGSTRGLALTFIGTNANFVVKNFAVVAMLAVPIPPTAPLGSRYTIQVLNPSGTSDGAEAAVALSPMAPRAITVAEVSYLAGDSSPATWYNADQQGLGFGEGGLNNNDVNNAFAASLGARVPYPFSDLFNSMDVFPPDSSAGAGGDGLIRFLDWQITLERSLGLDSARWVRTWTTNGVRVARNALAAGSPNLRAETLNAKARNGTWRRQALVTAIPQENVQPGTTVNMPIYASVATGYRLAGLAFRATISPEPSAPAVQRPVRFVGASGLPDPIQNAGSSPNVLLCGWPLVPTPSFNPALQSTRFLGYIQFAVPATAQAGQCYTLRFANADGSPDLHTQYELETRPASAWIKSLAKHPPETISDEWKAYFFGSLDAEAAAANADPDHDGMTNLDEYLAGTNPNDAQSRLGFETATYNQAKRALVLRWLTAPGKTYRVEASPDIQTSNWSVIAAGIQGDGEFQEWTHENSTSNARFYRLRLDQELIVDPNAIVPATSPASIGQNLDFQP